MYLLYAGPLPPVQLYVTNALLLLCASQLREAFTVVVPVPFVISDKSNLNKDKIVLYKLVLNSLLRDGSYYMVNSSFLSDNSQ